MEPLLEASGKRNWRIIMLTHDEFPPHCLLQIWCYPGHSKDDVIKCRMMTSFFRETTKRPFLEVNQNRNTTTTIVAKETTTGKRKIRQSISRDRSEL